MNRKVPCESMVESLLQSWIWEPVWPECGDEYKGHFEKVGCAELSCEHLNEAWSLLRKGYDPSGEEGLLEVGGCGGKMAEA